MWKTLRRLHLQKIYNLLALHTRLYIGCQNDFTGGREKGPTGNRWGRAAGTAADGSAQRRLRPESNAQDSRWEMTRATFTPEAPAWARPRVTPAPSPMAKKLGRAVSSSPERARREE